MKLFKSFTKLEKIFYFLAVCSLLITILAFFNKVNSKVLLIFSSLQAIIGVTGSFLNFKKQAIYLLFSSLGALTYAYISLISKNYGEAILNGLYMVPSYIISAIIYIKSHKETTNHVTFEVKKITAKTTIILSVLCVAVTIIYGLILKYILKSNFPFLNSLATALAICSVYMSASHINEQWYAWIGYSFICFILWGLTAQTLNESFPLFVQNLLYLLINGYALACLIKENKIQKKESL